MTSEQLLQAIQDKGLLVPEQIGKVRREALLRDKPAESILHEQNLIPDSQLSELKSELLHVPYAKVSADQIEAKVLELVPEETVRAYGVLPMYAKDGMLVVGMVNPDDTKAQEAIKFIAHQVNLNLGVFLVSYGDWQAVLRRYSPYRSEVQEAVRNMGLKLGSRPESLRTVELEDNKGGRSEDAPVIRIVANTLREALQTRASDIHIEPQEHQLRIRFRVDGDLKEASVMPVELASLIVTRVKILASLKTDETRVPQDGRFRSKVLDREVDFRVATFPTPFGEKVVLRILDPSAGLASMDNLGLTGQNQATVATGLQKPFGMILVSGPTGSGKSTTLYALLQSLNNESVNIVSLEDPVEYFISGINQSQVRPEIGYDFASGLRQILRQDPDVIMVGEIRDTETAGLAVNAALTGHIVLSTLHTNNAAGVIPRLIDMKVEPYLLPSALNLMVAQRLVSRICENCRASAPVPAALEPILTQELASLPEGSRFVPPYQIYHGAGCSKCKNKGTLGRVAIYEVLHMTPGLQALVIAHPTIPQIQAEGKAQGMLSMRQDGIMKALQGQVLLEEVLKETEEG
ncbi:MAG: type II/IV secretion system protein [Candidatus Liptonbacteria bacterium]|nr:type II/IV secretion system protein [Candidatus Liptonbacteria bacterium]